MTDALYHALCAIERDSCGADRNQYRMLQRRGWAEARHERYYGARWYYRLTEAGHIALRDERQRRGESTAPIPLHLLWLLCYAGGTHSRELRLQTLLLEHDALGLLTPRQREEIERRIEHQRRLEQPRASGLCDLDSTGSVFLARGVRYGEWPE